MENITIGQLGTFVGVVTPILVLLWTMFKIYRKIESTDNLTRINLEATNIMLNYFIENEIGNGEFKALRKKIDEELVRQ